MFSPSPEYKVSVENVPDENFDSIGYVYPAARTALDLLFQHESINGTIMIGDNGLAQGCLHQHKPHWERGCKYLNVDWKYPEDTNDIEKCEHIALANWILDCPNALTNNDIMSLLRHFRKPFDPYANDNDEYVNKVLSLRKPE